MPVYKDRKRGTWYVKYSRTVNGKREQVFKRGFATKKEAVLWESTETANNVSHTSMTFEDLFKEQLKFINSSETSSSMKKKNSWLIPSPGCTTRKRYLTIPLPRIKGGLRRQKTHEGYKYFLSQNPTFQHDVPQIGIIWVSRHKKS